MSYYRKGRHYFSDYLKNKQFALYDRRERKYVVFRHNFFHYTGNVLDALTTHEAALFGKEKAAYRGIRLQIKFISAPIMRRR